MKIKTIKKAVIQVLLSMVTFLPSVQPPIHMSVNANLEVNIMRQAQSACTPLPVVP
jgi:hypothetical protein